jgi:ATP-dependent helicase IRC3
MITLRPYQSEAINAWEKFVKDGGKRGIIHLPTGCGKTITALSIAKKMGGRMLWIAHRGELLDQAIKAMKLVWPEASCGVVKADRDEMDAYCVFATVQTISRRLKAHQSQGFDLIVVDEAHHSVASTYVNTLDVFGAFEKKGAVVLGLTATPERGDKLGLDAVFQQIVYSMQITEAVTKGYLCDLATSKVYLNIDLDKVKITAGDFNQGQLNDVMLKAEVPRAIAETYVEHAPNRKTIIFTVSKEQAFRTCVELQEKGVSAEYVTGDTPQDLREMILNRLATGETMVVVNCLVLTEGFDEPSVDCIIMARPTKSKPLYVQCIGRGTRKFLGKENCLIIDVTGSSNKHTLITTPSLFGLRDIDKTDSVIHEIEDAINNEKKIIDQELLRLRKMIDTPEARKMRDMVRWLESESNVFALPSGDGGTILIYKVEQELEDIDAAGDNWVVRAMYADAKLNEWLTPFPMDREMCQGIAENYILKHKGQHLVDGTAAWKSNPATQKQMDTLDRFKVAYEKDITRGEAAEEITKAIARLAKKRIDKEAKKARIEAKKGVKGVAVTTSNPRDGTRRSGYTSG